MFFLRSTLRFPFPLTNRRAIDPASLIGMPRNEGTLLLHHQRCRRVACREDGSNLLNLELLRCDQSNQQPRVECREIRSDWLILQPTVAPPSKVPGYIFFKYFFILFYSTVVRGRRTREGGLKTDEKTQMSAGWGSNPEPSDHVSSTLTTTPPRHDRYRRS